MEKFRFSQVSREALLLGEEGLRRAAVQALYVDALRLEVLHCRGTPEVHVALVAT